RCVCNSLRRFENSRNMEFLTSHEYDHVLSVLIRPPTSPCSLCASYESRTDGGSFSGGRLSFRRFENSRKVKFPLLGDHDILVSFIPTSSVESGTRIR